MIKAYFQNIQLELLKEISPAEKSLKIAVAWFTNNELFDALLSKCRKKLPVKLIIIRDSINIRKFGLDFNLFINEGGELYFGDTETLMHHKFCLVDDKVLINGSYNWTYWAETKNNENITILKQEDEVIKSFIKEFKKLILSKKPVQSIGADMLDNTSDKDNFFNLRTIQINEYISSAISFNQNGNEEMSAMIFEEVNKLNPIQANKVLQFGVASGNPVFKNIYKTISLKANTLAVETTYENYCSNILYCIQTGNYISAINLANVCALKFPGRFSVHVYCGDAKLKLHDKKGAEMEYRTASNYNHIEKAKIIYYNKIYVYDFFPKADVYLKLGEKDKATEILYKAVQVYKQKNMQIGAANAEKYLTQLNNNVTPLRIS